MFTLSHTTIINIHKEPVDMRLGAYSLQGLIAGSGCSVREGIQPSAFGLLLEGIELLQGMRKAWYER